MKILISEHARERIEQRKISQLKVYATVKNPETSDESYRNRILLRRNFGLKTLEVVIKVENSCIIIISAYYLE
ncbi:MAG: DUF4258 domain-containing protein [Candidatus Woesebacteria bacterium]|nr:DUF4258 domain-containing protein [Candidatus Woesebacteria bacterium]